MENCYWEKLKGSSNNPNLPDLETMQQFTLDAIAASGNGSMTDAQKWALNHFFYQIGAISDSGVFSKLEILCLPFIGGTKNGALTDFAKGLTAGSISGSVTFANGGFVASAAKTNIADYTLENGPDGNYFAFIAGAKSAPVRVILPCTDNITLTAQLDNNNTGIDLSTYVSYSSLITAGISSVENIKGVTMNINNGVGTIYAFNSETVQKMSATYHSSEDTHTFKRVVPRVGTTSNAPYAYAFGSNVTEEEQLAFTEAVKELMSAFA